MGEVSRGARHWVPRPHFKGPQSAGTDGISVRSYRKGSTLHNLLGTAAVKRHGAPRRPAAVPGSGVAPLPSASADAGETGVGAAGVADVGRAGVGVAIFADVRGARVGELRRVGEIVA